MTNEVYLYVSYFGAAAGGAGLALATTAVLAKPNRLATVGKARDTLGRILRRAFPAWLILAVAMGFASVTYFDCQHTNYTSITGDYDHLVRKTLEQASAMSYYLAAAIVAYGFVLVAFLWARARTSLNRAA
jgi:hypothetical protein